MWTNFTTRSIFGQYQLDLFDRLSTAGLRHGFNDQFDDAGTWLTAAYNLAETGTRLRFLWDCGQEPDHDGAHGFRSLQPNPDLKPERAGDGKSASSRTSSMTA